MATDPSGGYSGTPLSQKLGIRAGSSVGLSSAPAGFADLLEPLPEAVTIRRRIRGHFDVVIVFVDRRSALTARLPALEQAIFPNGGLWVAWPKRSSGVPTDMVEDAIREVALPRGLVDNKVCAIDATWSGLRLVWRRERRGTA